MTNKIKGVLFDFNGTMVFDGPEHKKAWSVFSLKYRGKPISDEEIDQMHGRTNKNIIQLLLSASISEEESEQLSKDKEALYREICKSEGEHYHLVEGLVEVLDELKRRKIPMTICSASIEDNINFFYDIFHLDRWFTRADIIFDDGSHLNKISMFQDGAKKIHIPIENCLIFEDSLSGIQCANEVHAAQIVAITTEDKIENYKRMAGVRKVIMDYSDIDMSLFDEKPV